jgi:lipopolysaccharide transport system ATP-binding protein
MENKSIHLYQANLHYLSLAYQERSFKKQVFRIVSGKKMKRLPDIHALKNITLTIKPGERVALIGSNGAGKSTLLKTIAGIYGLSSGQIVIKGQVRALFELNLGFETEATGRENIMYRGLLLGQTPQQVAAITNEVIDFADLGDFIDYPIKTYSAGMLVRLAFAISTAVKGDILLLDEVIAAGDAVFMQRTKRRVLNLINSAEILVLATHDLTSVTDLCNRAIVLDHGEILFDGDVDAAIQLYKKHWPTDTQ